MKRWFYAARLRLKYLVDGIKTRKQLHLMDRVIHEGELYFVNNGAKYDSEGFRLWNLVKVGPYDERGRRTSVEARSSEFKKVRSWANFHRGIWQNYQFQMRYWHGLNMRKAMHGRLW